MSYVLQYIAQGEHLHQDFKMRVDSSQKIARSLVAFANSEGGRLLIGVKDNGSICGISPNEELHMVIRSAEEFCRPALHFNHQLWKVDGKYVLEISVEESSKKPIQCLVDGEWISYIRVADKTWQASNVWNRMHAIHEDQGFSGNLFQFKERESQLFDLLKNQQMTLNQLARKLNLPRPVILNHLAKLMKWNILSETYVEGKFLYTLGKTTD